MVPTITSEHQDAPRQSLHHFAELVDRCICCVYLGLLVAPRIHSSLPLGVVERISRSHDLTPFSSTNILADHPPSNLPAASVIPPTPRASFPSHQVLCYRFRLAPILSWKSIKTRSTACRPSDSGISDAGRSGRSPRPQALEDLLHGSYSSFPCPLLFGW
jgi:hypothetical protein